MAAIWTLRRPETDESLVKVAAPVSSRTWQSAAYLANFLRGKGACLVPWCVPEITIANSQTHVFRFRVKNRSTAVARVWVLLLRATSADPGFLIIKAPASGGTQVVSDAPVVSLDRRFPLIYMEQLSSQTSTEAQIDISVSWGTGQGSASLIVEGVACYEQDRPLLAQDTTDYGVDVASCATGLPMYDASYASFGGLNNALAHCDARRVGIWHWTNGDATTAAITSATPQNLLQLGVPGLARKLARAATTGTVKWSVYGKMSASGTGVVTLSSTSGVSDAMNVTSTSYAWTTAQSVSIDCDNFSASDGRQSSRWDDLAIAFKGNGTQTLTIQSISIWSDD